jgi:hypothetical protein
MVRGEAGTGRANDQGKPMTRQDIINEPEGDNLDAWLAVHVMGWSRHNRHYWNDHNVRMHLVGSFSPSRYADSMCTVLKKFEEDFDCTIMICRMGRDRWSCSAGLAVAEGPTMILAVCRSILLAYFVADLAKDVAATDTGEPSE